MGARGRGGHAVLAGPGLGDDPPLAHAAGEQGLADRVVDLVGAGVGDVLTLEPDLRPASGLRAGPGELGEAAQGPFIYTCSQILK